MATKSLVRTPPERGELQRRMRSRSVRTGDGQAIHVIADNLPAHKTKLVDAFLD